VGVENDGGVATSSTGELGARHVSADEAVGLIGPGDHVFVGSACGTPRTLVEALERRDPPPRASCSCIR
jgi:acyl-CoA hydrolase